MEKKIIIEDKEYTFNGSVYKVMKAAEKQSLYNDFIYKIYIDNKCIAIFCHGIEV